MRKSISSLQNVNQIGTKFKYYKLILVSLIFAFTLTLTRAQSIPRKESEKWVIIFVDPKMTDHERGVMEIALRQDRAWYRSLGYEVYETNADTEVISKAILDGRVKSIAYYGHGGGDTPTFYYEDYDWWKAEIKTALVKHYKSQGYGQNEAMNLAHSQSQNFGLRDVINRSCGSLYDPSLADLFVSPENAYYGSLAQNYGFNPASYITEENDWTITEYTSQGASNYSPLPSSSVNDSGDSSFKCPNTNPEPGNSSEQIFPKPPQGELPKGTYVKCRYHFGGPILGSKIGYREDKRVIAEYFDSRDFLSKRIEYVNDKKSEVTNFYDTGKASSYSTYNSDGTRSTYKAWYKDGREK